MIHSQPVCQCKHANKSPQAEIGQYFFLHCIPLLRTGLLLLFFPQGKQTDTGNLDDLETNTGDITLGLALATETSDEDFVVLVHEVQATVIGD